MPLRSVERLRLKLKNQLSALAKELGADVVTSLIYDGTTDEFDLPVEYGLRAPEYFTDPTMRPGTDRLAGRIVKTKQRIVPISVPTESAVAGSFARRERIVSPAGFPLVHDGKSVGILFVSYRKAHIFSDDDANTIETTGIEIARSITQADVFKELRKERASQSLGPEDRTLRATVKLITQVLDRPAAIWLENPQGEYRVRAVSALRRWYLRNGLSKPGDRSLVACTIETGKFRAISHLKEGNDFPYNPSVFAAGWETVLAVPITLQGRHIGAIEVFGLAKFPLDAAGQKTLLRFADMAAEVAGTRIEESLKSQRLVAISQQLSGAKDFSSTMQILVEGARELTGAHSAIFARPWGNSKRFFSAAASTETPLQFRSQLPLTDSQAEEILKGPRNNNFH